MIRKRRSRKSQASSSGPAAMAPGNVVAPSESAASWRIGRPKGTGMQRVYAQVREDIIALRLPPGADLDESSLEQRFAVSRTPVREALIRLASEGLIILLPNRGARVTHIDISDIPPLFEALELCQRATTRWATARRSPADISDLRRMNQAFHEAVRNGDSESMGEINKEFHMLVGRACGNRYFESLYASLLAVSLRLARTAFAFAPTNDDYYENYYMEVVRQHEAMIDAIERGDAEAADNLARLHTNLFRERIDRYLNNNLAGGMKLGSSA